MKKNNNLMLAISFIAICLLIFFIKKNYFYKEYFNSSKKKKSIDKEETKQSFLDEITKPFKSFFNKKNEITKNLGKKKGTNLLDQLGTIANCKKEYNDDKKGNCYEQCPKPKKYNFKDIEVESEWEWQGERECKLKCPPIWRGKQTKDYCKKHIIVSKAGEDPKKSIPSECVPKKGKSVQKFRGLCYDLPSSQYYVPSVGKIAKKCPLGTYYNGSQCTYNRGKGIFPENGFCSLTRFKESGLCYKIAKPGFKCTVDNCVKANPSISKKGRKPDKCPSGREAIDGLCYPKCPKYYKRDSKNVESCISDCPRGFIEDDFGCKRPVHKLPKPKLVSDPKYGICLEGKKYEEGMCKDTMESKVKSTFTKISNGIKDNYEKYLK